MYLSSRSNIKRKKVDQDEDEIYYIHEFKRSHLEPPSKKPYIVLNKTEETTQGYLKPQKSNINLFNMCLRFIAENLEHVDSLNGFPEHIGHLLFNECNKINKFNSEINSNSFKCFNMFVREYSYCMIQSLNLANKSNLLNDFELIISKSVLKELDLSNCDLINFADLNSLLVESFSSLEYLNLSNNKLDENYVKKFTLAQRLNYSNYSSLARIDLSQNYKLKSILIISQLFEKYSKLNELSLSYSLDDSIDESKLVYFKLCKCNFDNFVNTYDSSNIVKNTGWISNLNIEKLISSNKKCINSSQEYKNFVREIRCGGKQENTKLNFYAKTTKISENYTTSEYLNQQYKCIKFKRDCKCFTSTQNTSRVLHSDQINTTTTTNNNNQIIKSRNYFIDKDLLNLYS